MIVFTIIGVWLVVMAVLLFTAFIFGYFLRADSEWNDDNFLSGLFLTICVYSFILCWIGVMFAENPEKYGYAKIETETVEVHEQVEHPESEVVIDE